MDEEHTAGYREPCAQCSEVSWGITEEGRFYCRSCHNVIERTQDVVDTSFVTNSQVSSISRASQKKAKSERGREWLVCEGFQFVLQHQADALLDMGVCPQFKDEVLCNLWRRYLQKSQQAYTRTPVHAARFQLSRQASESEDSAPESLGLSEVSWPPESETETEKASSASAGRSSDGASSACSGSLDGASYSSTQKGRSSMLMTMPMTLALCHLGLLWVREALTLADLRRFAAEGHLPYVNAYQDFPEEMRLYGRDTRIFRVDSVPSYEQIQRDSHRLARFLDLPRFPPITRDCLLHPSLLCLKYLTEANLPDELHGWVSRLVRQSGIGKEGHLTFDPVKGSAQLVCYDVQAVALIIVTMKLLFGLNDRTEWTLSNKANEENKKSQGRECSAETSSADQSFSLRRWYRTVQRVLEAARRGEERDWARKSWKSHKPLYPSKKDKSVFIKRRRVVEQLQMNFQRLSGPAPQPQRPAPSSFRFQWGEEGGDGPSFHRQSLACVLKEKGSSTRPFSIRYWHTALRRCDPRQCKDHFPEVEPTLPRTYVWLLDLFSFLLGVKPSLVHAEVCHLERRLVKDRTFPRPRKPGRKKRTKRTRREASPRETVSA
ncbi:TATA box-binding protein-associated factor RNA polymerase I subunit B [Megalops cyprinoides]|uniref:TATA box-binding protein-associated factor RNA polymerase I subunit B n=1 Tax=Megalops cyprinoides TaxID=118141 RepID=UPI001864E7F8|nr:TATA box-binding protein-associated factor RNA polymerase I subunit B [Megalops cyprinoides]